MNKQTNKLCPNYKSVHVSNSNSSNYKYVQLNISSYSCTIARDPSSLLLINDTCLVKWYIDDATLYSVDCRCTVQKTDPQNHSSFCVSRVTLHLQVARRCIPYREVDLAAPVVHWRAPPLENWTSELKVNIQVGWQSSNSEGFKLPQQRYFCIHLRSAVRLVVCTDQPWFGITIRLAFVQTNGVHNFITRTANKKDYVFLVKFQFKLARIRFKLERLFRGV